MGGKLTLAGSPRVAKLVEHQAAAFDSSFSANAHCLVTPFIFALLSHT
jgi:hypothetical protein